MVFGGDLDGDEDEENDDEDDKEDGLDDEDDDTNVRLVSDIARSTSSDKLGETDRSLSRG